MMRKITRHGSESWLTVKTMGFLALRHPSWSSGGTWVMSTPWRRLCLCPILSTVRSYPGKETQGLNSVGFEKKDKSVDELENNCIKISALEGCPSSWSPFYRSKNWYLISKKSLLNHGIWLGQGTWWFSGAPLLPTSGHRKAWRV